MSYMHKNVHSELEVSVWNFCSVLLHLLIICSGFVWGLVWLGLLFPFLPPTEREGVCPWNNLPLIWSTSLAHEWPDQTANQGATLSHIWADGLLEEGSKTYLIEQAGHYLQNMQEQQEWNNSVTSPYVPLLFSKHRYPRVHSSEA